MFGLISAGLSLASLAIGAQNSASARTQSEAAGKINQSKRRTQGVRETEELEARMVGSGVEMTQAGVANGSENISYSDSKAGFFGIGRKVGGDITGQRNYAGATDTASLLMGTSKDAIRLDVDAIGKNAQAQSDFYKQQTTGQLLSAGATLANTFVPRYADPAGGAPQNAWENAFSFLGGD